MTDQLLTAILVACATTSIAALCLLARCDRDSHIGRRLVEAAGSVKAAEREIEHVRMGRELNDRLRDKATDALMRRGFRARDNVVRFVPRVTSHGKPLHFTPDGAA